MTRVALSKFCFASAVAVLVIVAATGRRSLDAAVQEEEQGIQFNSNTPIQLDALIKYISGRMDMKFIYSPEIGDRSVILRTPPNAPASSFLPLFNAALRTRNLAIVDSEVPGWKRIIDAKDLSLFAGQGSTQGVGAATPVTKSFKLQYINAQQVSTVIKPFLSKPGSNVLAISESNVLIVTDYAPVVAMVEQLVKLLDVPGRDVTYEFYVVRHMASKDLAERASSLFGGKDSGSGGRRERDATKNDVEFLDDTHGNRVVIVGNRNQLQKALGLLRKLDTPLGLRTRVYKVQNLSADRLDKLIEGLLAPQEGKRTYRSTVDPDGNLLVIRATDAIHTKVSKLIRELDRPVQDGESPIQFYKLRNARATEVLATLLALQEAYGLGGLNNGGLQTGGFGAASPFFGGRSGGFYPGDNFNALQVNPVARQQANGGSLSMGAGGRSGLGGLGANRQSNGMNGGGLNGGGANGSDPNGISALQQNNQFGLPFGGGFGGGAAQGAAVLPGGARVSADVGTNSLIVVAPAGVQQMYANLIKSLDQRRPQVLIEAKIIAIDTSDNFALGVEVSTGDRTGANRLFKFTSFGLSEVDATSGALSISPSIGFNGALVDPEVADVVVQALSGHARARVLSVPKVLVNDNSTGSLESVVSVPFQSVNASDTVSTTSLGGNQSAGTIINVTPHINEDDNLQLEFDVEFSTFSGTGLDGLPPPRQVDRVASVVTIPDGKTVVVGGLKRNGTEDSFRGVPWIEKVPVLRDLTGRTTESKTTTSFFLFIRPLILRDSRFGDLQFVSNKELHRAGIPGQYPASGPVLMK